MKKCQCVFYASQCNTNLSIAVRHKLEKSDVFEFAVYRLQLVNNKVFAVRTQRFIVDSQQNGCSKALTHIAALLLNLQ